MTDSSDSGEKSNEPSPKKLDDARKKGQIPKSSDLSAAASYLGLILALTIFGPTTLLTAAEHITQLLANPEGFISPTSLPDRTSLSRLLASTSMHSLFPMLSIPAAAVLVSLLAQQAITFAPSKIAPKLNKISPLTAFKNKFGASGIFEFLKSFLKLLIVSSLMVFFLRSSLPELIQTIAESPAQMTITLSEHIISFLTIIFVMSLLIGGGDYLWQVAEHLRKHRMTRKELEDENKEAEGDPHNKQARRQRGFEIAMNQMLSDIPDASVVIVNPTHFAVALTWDELSGGAPICVAKGVDEIAARIREVATNSNVPIFSDPPTARSLFARIEIGQEIWPDDYQAVAAAIRFANTMNAEAKTSK